jgi:hypothetical protein
MRPQNGQQSGQQNGGQRTGGPQTGSQQTGSQQTGQQTQDTTTQTQPDSEQRNTALATWLDEVIAAGGITADATDVERLEAASEHLTEVIAAGGTELATDQERLLGSVARDLRRVSQRGDSTVTTDDTAYPTLLGQAEYRLEEFLTAQRDALSDEAKSRLTGALATLETVYADGVVSTAERTDVGTAADAVCGVLKDDFVKLSDAGLATLQDQADDLALLVDDGFLTLDGDQWTAINTADTALAALLAGGGDTERTAVHEALAGLHGVLMGAILDLANPADELRTRGQFGGGGGGADLFAV